MNAQKRVFSPPFQYKSGVMCTGSFDATKTHYNKNGAVSMGPES